MNLIDLIYAKNHNSAKGKIHLRNRLGEPVTVTKEIRYTVTDGQLSVHINGYDDLSEYCRTAGYTDRGKAVWLEPNKTPQLFINNKQRLQAVAQKTAEVLREYSHLQTKEETKNELLPA